MLAALHPKAVTAKGPKRRGNGAQGEKPCPKKPKRLPAGPTPELPHAFPVPAKAAPVRCRFAARAGANLPKGLTPPQSAAPPLATPGRSGSSRPQGASPCLPGRHARPRPGNRRLCAQMKDGDEKRPVVLGGAASISKNGRQNFHHEIEHFSQGRKDAACSLLVFLFDFLARRPCRENFFALWLAGHNSSI